MMNFPINERQVIEFQYVSCAPGHQITPIACEKKPNNNGNSSVAALVCHKKGVRDCVKFPL